MIFYRVLVFVLMLISTATFAQGQEVEMADAMRESGKIYVVVAVLVTILIGILFYLINTERRLNKLEKELEGES